MLEVSELEVDHGPVAAVRGISLTVAARDATALLGPNGAGKTSTLRAVSGLCGYRGSVRFDGIEVAKAGPEKLARAGLLHVPEGRHVFPNLTVHENLQVGQVAAAGRPGHSLADVYDLFPPLQPLRSRPGWMLSGGEQQMVAIGRALVAAPRLLLLDEPSLGLAPIMVKAVYSVLGQILDTTPVLLVEQNTTAALDTCSYALVLVGGQVAVEGSAEDLSDRDALLGSYLGQTTAPSVAQRASS